MCGHSLRESSEVSHGVQVTSGQSPPSQLTQGPAHTVSRQTPPPGQGPALQSPLLSAHSPSICIPSPPPFSPPYPRPPSLGDKRARLERVPRSFTPHHMGPKAKSSAKRLNQVCRTKCYELTLWVYNFMPFVAICLSKQPPFHTDIQTHTFPPTPHPPSGFHSPPHQPEPRVRDKKTCARKWRARDSRALGDGRGRVQTTHWPGKGQGPWDARSERVRSPGRKECG